MSIYSKNLIRISLVIVIAFALNHLLFSQSSVNTISQLRALSPGASSRVTVLGYYESGDWGNQRTYNWVGTSTAADNGGTIIRPDAGGTGRWIMVVTENYYNVKWFGARGEDNPSHNDHVGILNCLEAVAASSAVAKIFFPIGIYQLTIPITLLKHHSGITFEGENLAFKMEEIPRNEEFPITWSPVTEFRVVDETNSAVIKKAPNNNQNYLFRFGIDQAVDNVIVKNLAFNGNRWESTENANIIRVLWGNGDNNRMENIAIYLSRGTGISIHDQMKFLVDGLLAYQNNWHGGSSRGFATFRNVETHHNGFGEQRGHQEPGAQGLDMALVDNTVENFWSHHNLQGVKSATYGLATTWKNGVVEYNYGVGIQHTQDDTQPQLKNLYYQNIITRHNGRAGILNSKIERVNIEEIESLDNGYLGSASLILRNVNAYRINASDDKKHFVDYFRSSILFYGLSNIRNIRVLNNDKTGIEIYEGTTKIESGKIYNNSDGGVHVVSGRTLIIGNVDFDNNGMYDINNEGTVKYTALSGNPVFTGGGTFIKLPESGITSTVVTGTSVTLTYQAFTDQPGRNISSVRVYKYVPGSENPLNNIEDTLIDTKSGPGPHETTIGGLQEGERYIFYTIAVDNQGDEGIKPLDFDGTIRGTLVEIQNISLQSGWNIISSRTIPGNTNLPDLFSEITDNLQLVKNGEGDVYDPSNGDNDIGPWEYSQAYRVFVNNPVLLIIGGTPIDPGSSPINLKEGRNFTAYYLSEPMNIEAALASIGNKLELVADINGNIYWPARGINSIGAMKPGEGYIIHVTEDVTLVYPSNSN